MGRGRRESRPFGGWGFGWSRPKGFGLSEFVCDACDRRFAWSREKAGRRARCRCGATLTVLAPFAGFLLCIGPLAFPGLMIYAAVLHVGLMIDLFNGVNDRRVRLAR